ncbi:FMN-binding protein [Clostridium thailandense]|uniref:FMN-binding protein n=1 Tax=Clostridium thailandense TaxID=2794346 RepID=UPI003989A17B
MKTNIKNMRYIRYAVQSTGIFLTVIGLFTNYPMVNSILLGATIIMGPVFCGWICPFGTLQDVFAKLGRRLGIKKHIMPAKLKKVLAFSRYILLLVTILITADFIFNLLSLDPRANFTTFLGDRTVAITGWIIIFIFLGISMFFERPFCNYLCIEGAKFGVLGSIRPFTIIRNSNTCVGCNKCNRTCPMNINVASYAQVRSLQCINCMECVAACPVKNTLTFGVVPVNKILKKIMVSLAAVAFVVVVYKGINTDSLFSLSESNNSAVSSTVIAGQTASGYGDAKGISDGVYKGTGNGFRGQMTVEVTIKNEQITEVKVIETNDDAKWFDRAYSTVVSSIISKQTVEVDSVSGATYSSMGIKEAVSNALQNAGGKNVKTIVNDLPAAGEQQHRKRK